MRTRLQIGGIWHVVLILFLVLMLYPLIYALGNSFKSLSESYGTTLNVLPKLFTLENYQAFFNSLPVIRITLNTFFLGAVTTIVKLVTSFLAAYAFVYFRVKYKPALYFLLISTIFVPFTVTMIPNYLFISRLGLIDSVWGAILPQLADAIGIFLITQSMRGIPYSLIEVARLDRLPHRRIMLDIVLPLVRPAVTSTGIWFFITTWNEYVWPVLILKSTEQYTLPLALQMYISAEGGTNFTVAMAVSVVTMAIPLALYIMFQRYIIGTFASSGIK